MSCLLAYLALALFHPSSRFALILARHPSFQVALARLGMSHALHSAIRFAGQIVVLDLDRRQLTYSTQNIKEIA